MEEQCTELYETPQGWSFSVKSTPVSRRDAFEPLTHVLIPSRRDLRRDEEV